MTIGKKLVISFLGIATIFQLSGIFFKFTLDEIRVKGQLYNQIIANKDLIADILPPPAYIIESYLCAMEAATAENDPMQREKLLVRIKELSDGPGFYQERMKFWESNLTNQEVRTIFFQDAQQHARNFFTAALGPFASAIRSNNMNQAQQIFIQQLKPQYNEHRKAIDQVVEMANADSRALENRSDEVVQSRQTAILVVFLAILALSLSLGVLISRNISRPITSGVQILEQIAQGNMLQKIPENLRRRNDEVGEMASSLNTMVNQLGSMIRDIVAGVQSLTSSSAGLTTVSRHLLVVAKESSEKSYSAATASEEMNSNMQSISAATEQSSNNINMIASSTEEMIATISEISKNTDSARSITENAVQQALLTSEKMSSLGESARKIGRVTETITEISEQTNLLALNATIEAARAGDAGKGFAVVANEIKELAKQTATATIDIKNQIVEMQTTTTTTVEDIAAISKVIENINTMIIGIAAAVDQQSAASKEIANNLAHASQGITEINHNVASSSLVTAEISREIHIISQHSSQVEDESQQVQDSAESLSELATRLEILVQKFKV